MTLKNPKACIACREGKRKCDRLIPSCSLCSRLGRRCQYGNLMATRAPGSRTSFINRHTKHDVPQQEPSLARKLPENKESGLFSIHNAITEKLLQAVGDVSAIRKGAAKYFETIHLWFPVMSKDKYYQEFARSLEEPRTDYSLLSLSMALITTLPSEKTTFTELYILVKTSIAMVEAANLNTLAVVQSRLLVTLFEFGHGLAAAFISIASTVRAAVAIGLNHSMHKPCGDVAVMSDESEESHCVWWGIVMLDRIYTLERNDGPCATQSLGSPRHLPRDMSNLDQSIFSSPTPLPLSTPSSISVGPFARQAQVSHVLDIFLMHLCDKKPTPYFKKEESDQIARTLTAFSLLLPEDAPQPWPRYCGAIGMCYTALMKLHSDFCDPMSTIEIGDPTSAESLASALSRLNHISRRFNDNIHEVDIDALSPFPPCGLSKAASVQFHLWRETGDSKYRNVVDSLIVMLTHFSKRWGNAGKLLDFLLDDCKPTEES